ncbi:MAG TPA: hypothetical protein PKA33_18925 [Amaricoccus sp.]|uniref:hypothetical protein n=1 Tax=Amaricoccus sp. TaxID=1872485 RepID=UPI002CB85A24|nr:hypothetical protein [Amaricoccus sp.]HMQ94685.1 hypothetical protein [Amaricoccus sp.]HMR54394.1 hypothetical protein [Amaricoccus sp.]HMU01416.1 hypothetical protein [Amaricoccus sp.]
MTTEVRDIVTGARAGAWIAVVTVASLVFGLVPACATPLAAVVAVVGRGILWTNLLALARRLVLHRLAVVSGLLATPRASAA